MIVAPYAQIFEEARAALPRGTRLVDTGTDDEAYWRLLRDLWVDRKTFVIVEHDIIATEAQLTEMEACPAEWCAAPYPFEAWPDLLGLGCAKFSQGLMEAVPDALERVSRYTDKVHPARHWCALDSRLSAVLLESGKKRHVHSPVYHLSTRRGHTCA